jgi:deoxyribonuclease V
LLSNRKAAFVSGRRISYNYAVEFKNIHDWPRTAAQAIALQKRLAPLVVKEGRIESPALIAGVDMAAGRAGQPARAAVVVLSYPELEVVATETACGELSLPYIPGLLSFRELPLILSALKKLRVTPDLFMVDGQGIAHPRRFGLASHLGLFTGRPTIGCAKSRLCGQSLPPGQETGSLSRLKDGDEVIGAVLRTRAGVKPVYVSIGSGIGLEAAVEWVLAAGRGYRLPEPLRLAHRAAAGNPLEIARAEEAGCRS